MAAPLTPGTIWKLALAYRWSEGQAAPRVRMQIANRVVAQWSRAPIGADLPFPESEEEGAKEFELQLSEQGDQLPHGTYPGKLEFLDPSGSSRRAYAFRVTGSGLDGGGGHDSTANHLRMADTLVASAMETVLRIERVQGALIDQQAHAIEKLMQQSLSMGNQLIATSQHLTALLGEQQAARLAAEARALEFEALHRQSSGNNGSGIKEFFEEIPEEVKEHAPALMSAALEFLTTPKAGAIVKGNVQ